MGLSSRHCLCLQRWFGSVFFIGLTGVGTGGGRGVPWRAKLLRLNTQIYGL